MSLASQPTPQFKNPSWWQRRTRLERRLSLLATIFVFVAVGFAVAVAALVYRTPDNSPSHKVFSTESLAVVSPSAAAFTQSSSDLAEQSNKEDPICDTPGCVLAAADLLKSMDKTVDPCQDFYQFACGGFEKSNTIPDDQSSVTTFSLISDQVTEQLRTLVEKPIKEEEPTPFKLLKKLYQSCLNKSHAEEVGLSPLKEVLSEFGGWPAVVGDDWDESSFVWYQMIYQFRRVGYSIDYFVDFSIIADLKNSTSRVIDLDQATLGMPGREYLLKGLDDKDVKAYLEYQVGLATLLGADRDRARKEQTDALLFEIQLANISLPREERRDANKLYNPMTIRELSARIPSIPWLDYINTVLAPFHNITEDERVIVDVPDYFAKLTDLLDNTPKRTLANYLLWRVSGASVSYLNEAARNLQLKYSSALTGTTERKPRWEECTELVSGSFGNAVGALYVREYFEEAARQSAKEMVKDIRDTFDEILDELEWMDDETRIRAKDKAASMTTHIAYPDELLDDEKLTNLYGDLQLDSTNYLRNALNLTVFGTNYSFKKLREAVNKTDWVSHGRPAVVNAYYSPLENSIQFPAGILQGAFFGKNRPSYLNYAAIGWVIGHEITHGFDDQGRQFGRDGNLAEWWAPQTKKQYLERAQCIIGQYGNYSFPELGGLKINGINTQGENIADNGGIKEAYRAYIKWAERQKPGKW
nr:EOG090X01U4 [Polyphemus pediculus]